MKTNRTFHSQNYGKTLINKAQELYRTHFTAFFLMGLFFLIPSLILGYFLGGTISDIMDTIAGTFPLPEEENKRFLSLLSSFFRFYSVQSLLNFFYTCLLIQWLTLLFSPESPETRPTISTAVLKTIKTAPQLLITFLLWNLMLFFGYLFCFLPGILLKIFLLLVPFVMIAEQKYFFTSFDRSFFLIKKNALQTMLIPLFFFLILYFLSLSVTMGINLFLPQKLLAHSKIFSPVFIELSINYILFILITPLSEIALYLQYLRLKKERDETSPSSNTQQQEEPYQKPTLEDYYKGKEEEEEE